MLKYALTLAALMVALSTAACQAQTGSSISGVYLGAWTNRTEKGERKANKAEMEAQTEALEARLGRRFAIQLSYYGMGTLTSDALARDPIIQGDLAFGRTPMISYTCRDSLTNIANGADKGRIDAAALALKNLRTPSGKTPQVLLRFFHEFNLCGVTSSKCANGDYPGCFDQSYSTAQKGAQFVRAWEYLYHEMVDVMGARNVSFVWNPNGNADDVRNVDLSQFLPPASCGCVQWIGWDVYDKKDVGLAATISPFYDIFSKYHLPMILAETGELANGGQSHTQRQYFQDLGSLAPTRFPMLHGFVYFGAFPSRWDWRLDDDGLAEMAKLGKEPYFDRMLPPL